MSPRIAKIQRSANMDRIIASLEPYSISEISRMLGFDEAKFGKRFCGELKYKRGGKLKDKKNGCVGLAQSLLACAMQMKLSLLQRLNAQS